jgi:cell division protein ZapA
MAQVTLRINGYAYTVGCKDGEEQHLISMGNEVERRIDSIKAAAGQSGEARMLVMAALLMADDLFEMQRRLDEKPTADGNPPKPDARLGRKLNKIAKRAEDIAADLEPT